MSQMTDIQNTIIKFRVQALIALIVFVIGATWRGTLWYNGVIRNQERGTARIMAKIDSGNSAQKIINLKQYYRDKGQSDSLLLMVRK